MGSCFAGVRIWPRGPSGSSAWEQQKPPASPGFPSTDFMLSPANGWEGGAEEGGSLTLCSCSCLWDKSVTHFAFLLKTGLKAPSLFNVYVVLAKHHVSGLEITWPVQAHLNTKVLRSLLSYTHVRSPQTMANLRFISGDKFWGQTISVFSYKSPKWQLLVLCCYSGNSEGSQDVSLSTLRALAPKTWSRPGDSSNKAWLVETKLLWICPTEQHLPSAAGQERSFQRCWQPARAHGCRIEQPLIGSAC